MKVQVLVLVVLAIVLFQCSAQTPTSAYKKDPSIIGNQKLISMLEGLESKAVYQNLTMQDLEPIKPLLGADEFALEQYADASGLIDGGIPDHADHAISFIRYYIQSGDALVCVPHEIEHVGLYLEIGKTDSAKSAAEIAQRSLPKWMSKQEKSKKAFPQLYRNYDEVVSKTKHILDAVNSGNYNGLKDDINYVSVNGVC